MLFRSELKNTKLENGDIIKVCQVGSSNRIFRESEEYAYYEGSLISPEELPKEDSEQPEDMSGDTMDDGQSGGANE